MPHEFDPAAHVVAYRDAVAQHDAAPTEQTKATLDRLQKEWKDWNGDDELHEMAFGEPIGDTEETSEATPYVKPPRPAYLPPPQELADWQKESGTEKAREKKRRCLRRCQNHPNLYCIHPDPHGGAHECSECNRL